MDVNKCDLHSILENLKETNNEEIKVKTKISVQKDEIIKTKNMIEKFQDCLSQQKERLLQLCTDHDNIKCRRNQLIEDIKHLDNNDVAEFLQEDISLKSLNNTLIVPNQNKSIPCNISNEKDLKRNIKGDDIEASPVNDSIEILNLKKRKVDDSMNIESDKDGKKLTERMYEPNLPPKEPRPCFSCADKNEDIRKLHVYIGTLKKRIETYEGMWFSPPQMKEEKAKILRLEHRRDSLLEESRCQRLTIKAQSEVLHKVYSESEIQKRVREYPIKDGTNVLPLHHCSDEVLQPLTNCSGYGLHFPPLVDPVLPVSSTKTDSLTTTDKSVPSTSSIDQAIAPTVPTSKKRKRPSRAEKNQKRRDTIAALEASLFAAQASNQSISEARTPVEKEPF